MTTRRWITTLAVPLIAAASLGAAGPPWISIEYPANPHDPETRGALLVVHTYHHERAIESSDMAAEAIGMLEGRRVVLPLDIQPTSRSGIYAIRGELKGTGTWVVRVARDAAGQSATALVAMNGQREILAVQVPSRSIEGGQWLVPREPSADEVELMLRTATAMNDAARSTRLAAGAGAALLLLVLIPSGALLARRRPL